MNCNEAKEKLLEYVSGLLNGEKKNELERHLQECSSCRHSADFLLAEESLIRGILRDLSMNRSVLPRVLRKAVPVYKTAWGRLAIAASAIAAVVLITLLFSSPFVATEYTAFQTPQPPFINAEGNSSIIYSSPLPKNQNRYSNPPAIEPLLKDRLTDEGTD
ncbi:MAG: zf-HC2 domain-containing protein [Planctomycetota bacterium]|nr:zf-HC2 domain-containing protein [Planctomycetota bacterium]